MLDLLVVKLVDRPILAADKMGRQGQVGSLRNP
jgi:hypothetical protein